MGVILCLILPLSLSLVQKKFARGGGGGGGGGVAVWQSVDIIYEATYLVLSKSQYIV